MKIRSAVVGAVALASVLAAFPGSAASASVLQSSPLVVTPEEQHTAAAAKPVRGDFDGDGRDDIFWYVPGAGADVLWSGKPRVDSASTPEDRFDTQTLSISGTYAPIPGDFDGDGDDDIFWYAAGPNPDSVWYFTGRGTLTSVATPISGTYVPYVGNFNTGGTSAQSDDIFWASSAGSYLWSGGSDQSFATRSYVTKPPAGAKVLLGNWRQTSTTAGAAVHQDILFYVPGSGADSIWVGDGTGAFTSSAISVGGTYEPVVGNFDTSTGPEMTDIVWYAAGTARDSVWMNAGAEFDSSTVTVNGKYKPVVIEAEAAGGHDHIMWNNLTGTDSIWRTDGSSGTFSYESLSLSAFGATDPGARSAIIGDYDTRYGVSSEEHLSAGDEHSCVLTPAGGVKCWGANEAGQLGRGNTTASTTPVNVSGLSSGVAKISSGGHGTCVVTTEGGAKCWGRNQFGQLGNGNTTTSTIPVNVTGLTSGVASVAVGAEHACALTTAGGVKCWGDNRHGQLGNGSTTNTNTPVNVTGLTSGVVQISAGTWHTCAVTSEGGVKCWGYNLYGQLGNGGETDVSTPVNVTGLSSGVARVSAGFWHTCALLNSGTVKCWGDNQYGKLGNGTTTSSKTPVTVTGLGGTSRIEAGWQHTCAISDEGGVKCWGFNASGQLGIGTTTSSSTPVQVSGLTSDIAEIPRGAYHSCALTVSGIVKCWGDNEWGQIGNGTTTNAKTPANVSGGASYYVSNEPVLPPAADMLWWAPGNGTTQTELMWLEVENI